MNIIDRFVTDFGAEQANAIIVAAEGHANGINSENRGSDPFKWALLICIGYECVTRFRDSHGITIEPDVLRAWVIEHAYLGSHDGDGDYLTAATGKYDEWMRRSAMLKPTP